MINPASIIRIEKQHRKNGGPRTVYIVKCRYELCTKEVKIRAGCDRYSGLCQSHAHVKRPFESIYNRLFNDHRKTKVDLTYEQFIELAAQKHCYYCEQQLDRRPFATIDGVYYSAAHFLDKKDPEGPYSKDNCVPCCTNCNKIKNNLLTHDEMVVAMKAVIKFRRAA